MTKSSEDLSEVMKSILIFKSCNACAESTDCTEILARAYRLYFKNKGIPFKILDHEDGDTGYKNLTLLVNIAPEIIKSENGTHRFVRISPFDAQNRRHTSFTELKTFPFFKSEFNEDEMKFDFVRGGGFAGMRLYPDSTVWATKEDLKVKVCCSRSRKENKELAADLLYSLFKSGGPDDWQKPIRSYVFQPYQLVKDHRSQFFKNDVSKVFKGDLDGFIGNFEENPVDENLP